MARTRVLVRGLVQGVGFRPFVHGLARELSLIGHVINTGDGVVIEVEGPASLVADLPDLIRRRAPTTAVVDSLEVRHLAPVGGTGFSIRESLGTGRTWVAPDLATCDGCLAEMRDPADRRFRHAFISCTHCGPRFTVIVGLPYDRPATTMAGLPLCKVCAAEYADPDDRRFHAQTIACRDCGPTLRLTRTGTGDLLGDTALLEGRRLLAAGAVVAVKGLGGWHLACDARNESAVATLRKRKDRGDKPFAVMVADLDTAAEIGALTDAERGLLVDPRRPVVLLRRGSGRLAPSVAPNHPDVGVMLAYTPVHHLLLSGDGPAVLVMSSGNLAGEPIVTDDAEALLRLGSLADAWLGHDRPIHVPCDDSVVRVAGGAVLPVRRSRGYAPLPIRLPVEVRPALAVGGDLKNTFCLGDGRHAWLSAHVGDMVDLATQRAFGAATAQLGAVTGVIPEVAVVDAHPGYRSAALGRRLGLRVVEVQHHHAHIASAMAENGWGLDDGPVIGFAFDGTGYGVDGAVWGGEVLIADYTGFERAAHLRYVPLPGGDAGVRNPCRMALSHLRTAGVGWDPRLPSVAACSAEERRVLDVQLTRGGLATVPTSSMGRLFDAVSSLAGVCHRVAYEAEAAMRFEELARDALDGERAPYRFGAGFAAAPVICAAAADVLAGVPAAVVSARFHLAVADTVLALAREVRADRGLSAVALSGGVFLNALLTVMCRERLLAHDFLVLDHHVVPPSDAGLALGQLAVGARSVASSGRADERRAACA